MSAVLRRGVLSVVVLGDAGDSPAQYARAVQTVRESVGRAPEQVQVLDSVGAGSRGATANAAAAQADGEFLAFVSASVAASANRLSALVSVLERNNSLGGVGPAAPDAVLGERDVLSLKPDLVVFRHAAFRAADGFEESLAGVLDDVDLGWRLTLLGYRLQERGEVRLVLPPRAGTERELARARLLVAYRNLGDEHLPLLFAADGVDTALPDVELPASQRAAVQASRVADERQVLRLVAHSDLGLNWFAPDLADTALLAAFGGVRHVLIVTGDTLGARMAGPAIRAWEIAHALAAEHDVVLAAIGGCTISSPTVSCRSVNGTELRALVAACDVLVFQGFLLRDQPWIEDTGALLVADMYDPVHLEVLEQERHRPLVERTAMQRDSVDTINGQLRRADFFLCASTKQRDFWLGHLASLGRVNPLTYDGDEDLDRLIAIAPFGISATPPERTRAALKGVVPGIGEHDKVILWGGGIYNWFDPLTLLHAIDRIRHHRPDVRLYFLGTKHPNPAVPAMRMAAETRDLSERLGLTDSCVFFNEDWVAYDDRQNYLLDADIGVSCHYRHVETAFSFRTRILDYLWAGLPIVTTEGDAFGDLVTAHELGAAVPAEDVDALVAALLRLLDDDEHAAACRKRVAEVAPDYIWERALAPLVRFCRDPRAARDRLAGQLPDPAAGLPRARRTVRANLSLARHYLRVGGVRDTVRRAARRLLRQLGER